MDVSIIIVNYNTISLLINAVDSVILKTEGIEYEIIIIDINSKENPNNILTEKYGDKIILLRLSENTGFGRANNEVAKIAKGMSNGYPMAAIIGKKKFMDAAQDTFISSTYWKVY